MTIIMKDPTIVQKMLKDPIITRENRYDLMAKLKSGEISPKFRIDSEFGDIILLEAMILSNEGAVFIDTLLENGCDVDHIDGAIMNCSPLEFVCSDKFFYEFTKYNNPEKVAKIMLQYHKSSSRDIELLYNAKTRHKVLGFICKSGKVNLNAVDADNNHVLHLLAKEDKYQFTIKDLLSNSLVKPNVKNNNGCTPLSIAINFNQKDNIKLFLKNSFSWNDASGKAVEGGVELIGFDGVDPQKIIDLDMINTYQRHGRRNFWGDFPEMISYAISLGKENELPEDIRNLFIF